MPLNKKKAKSGWTKDEIIAMLDSRDDAVIRAALAIYARQTEDEKSSMDTKWKNGIGFAANDAEGMTRFCNFVRADKTISSRFMAYARGRMKRYHRQLIEIANSRNPKETS